jgi:hypothetical protein
MSPTENIEEPKNPILTPVADVTDVILDTHPRHAPTGLPATNLANARLFPLQMGMRNFPASLR